jgi:hypothetical protein
VTYEAMSIHTGKKKLLYKNYGLSDPKTKQKQQKSKQV